MSKFAVCAYVGYRMTTVSIHITTRYKLIKVIPPVYGLVDGRNVLSWCYTFI